MTFDIQSELDQERGRGILTQADRDFLRGKKEYANEQSERDARYRIRQRVKNAVMDFSILLRYMQEKDRKQIFSNYFTESKQPDPNSLTKDDLQDIIQETMFIGGVSDAIGLFYLGATDTGTPFDEVIEAGLSSGEEQRGFVVESVEVSFNISREEPDTDDLLNKLLSGEGLSAEGLRAVLRSESSNMDREALDEIFTQLSDDMSGDIDEGDLDLNVSLDDSA